MSAWSTTESSDAQIFLIAPGGEVVAEFTGDWPHPAQDWAREIVRGLNLLAAERARNERLMAALREILVGKVQSDNKHPLTPSFAMVSRFMDIARSALDESKPQEEQSK